MKVNRKELQNALALARRMITKKEVIPVLSNVLIKDGKLTATNLDQTIEVVLDTAGKEEICASCATLHDIVSRLNEETVEIIEADNGYFLDGKKIRIAKTTPDQFPTLPVRPSTSVLKFDVTYLKIAFGAMLHGTSEERAIFTDKANFVYFDGKDGECFCVATDGNRLAKVKGTYEGGDFGFVMPLYAVRVLANVLNNNAVEVSEDDNHLFFAFGEVQYIFRKSTMKAVDWRFLIKSYPPTLATKTIADPITDALSLTQIVVDERSKTVNWDINGALEMFVKSEDGDIARTVPFDASFAIQTAFNVGYLLPVFQYFKGDIDISFSEKTLKDGEREYKQYYMYVTQGDVEFLVGSQRRWDTAS